METKADMKNWCPRSGGATEDRTVVVGQMNAGEKADCGRFAVERFARPRVCQFQLRRSAMQHHVRLSIRTDLLVDKRHNV
jgi:hypothetical protein